ncbi:MAG: hypothetical protein AB1650_08645 [Candidatus Omnitrophota bacterium]
MHISENLKFGSGRFGKYAGYSRFEIPLTQHIFQQPFKIPKRLTDPDEKAREKDALTLVAYRGVPENSRTPSGVFIITSLNAYGGYPACFDYSFLLGSLGDFTRFAGFKCY